MLMLRLFARKWAIRFALFAVVVSVIAALVYRTYHFLRGRRNRNNGIPCIRCHRTAFPIEGLATRYRCGICQHRFQGPEHW
jgi:hypothetical protein